MFTRAIASAVLMAAAVSAGSVGSAVVVNACKYQVHLANTPAADGGYSEIDKVLQPGDTYSQQYTELTNQNGWSIKLSKTAELNSILQYEYTYHNDGIIWYDLSEVNGNPWDGDWEILATGDNCTPKQQAYRYATDDAYGMQSCLSGATITVTLCSGESQNNGAGASSSAASQTSKASTSEYISPVAPSPVAAPSVSAAHVESPTTTALPAASSSSHTWNFGQPPAGGVVNDNVQVAASTSLTTFATVATSSDIGQGYDYTVTDVQTTVVTAYVTATATAEKRSVHEHHHQHPHNRRA